MGSDFSAWLFLCGRKCHANCKDIAIRCVAFSGGVEATSSSFCQRLSKFQNRVTVCEMTFFHAAATLPGIMKSYEILPYTSPTLDFQLRSILHLRRSTPEFYRFSSFFFVKNRDEGPHPSPWVAQQFVPGSDVMVTAQTGSGKTAAFLVALLYFQKRNLGELPGWLRMQGGYIQFVLWNAYWIDIMRCNRCRQHGMTWG